MTTGISDEAVLTARPAVRLQARTTARTCKTVRAVFLLFRLNASPAALFTSFETTPVSDLVSLNLFAEVGQGADQIKHSETVVHEDGGLCIDGCGRGHIRVLAGRTAAGSGELSAQRTGDQEGRGGEKSARAR